MNIGKPGKLGKTIEDVEEGDSLSLTESIKDKDLLLYLGLINGVNPLYTQHDHAQKAEYGKPVVPSIMLMGIITSAIPKHLSGPGSHVMNFSVNSVEPIFHYEILTFQLEVIKVDKMKDVTTISVEGVNEQEDRVLGVVVMIQPPQVTTDELTEKEGTLTYE